MRRLLPIFAALFLAGACASRPDAYVQITGRAQGGEYSVKMNMKGVSVPVESVRDSIDAILLGIDTTLSGYNSHSLLARFNAGERIRPNTLFLQMYEDAYAYWERSGGLLDFAAGPLYDAWGFGFRDGALPTDAQVASLLGNCGMSRLPRRLPVSEDGWLDPAGMGFPRLNYNAVAQGYSCDLVARFLYGLGVKDMLVDIGEIWCDGLNPSGRPWAVGVDRPVDRENGNEQAGLSDVWSSEGRPCGITTSGNYRKYYVRDGRKYAHTINPLTGYPVQHNLLSATVVSAASAAESDALATWCMVIGLDAAKELILHEPGVEGYLVSAAPDGQFVEWASPGFTLKGN